MESKSFRLFDAAIKSDQTRIVYHGTIKQYMKFYGMKNYDEIIKGSSDKIQQMLEDWVMAQSEQMYLSESKNELDYLSNL